MIVFIQMYTSMSLSSLTIENNLSIANILFFFSSINIHDELIQHHHWCSRLSSYLSTIDSNDIDQIEKILLSMISFADACGHNWISVLPIIEKFLANSTKDNLESIENFRTNLSQIFINDL